MTTLRLAWTWVRRYWWALLLGALTVGTAILHRLARAPSLPLGPPPPTPIRDAIRQRVEAAEEDSLRVRVETQTETRVAKEALDQVSAIEDGAERRRRLAEMLRGL
mgnify:CR=1 FL=1